MRNSLVHAMGRAYADCQIIHTGLFHEDLCLVRIGIWIIIAAVQVILLAADLAKLSFY